MTYEDILNKDSGWWESTSEKDFKAFINGGNGDINAKDRFGQEQNLLHMAILNNKPGLVDVLLNKGISSDATDVNGDTPLHIAARTKDRQVVDLLLKYRANTSILNKSGDTPASIAFSNGEPYIIEAIMKKMKDKNIKNSDGETLLHISAKTGNIEMVQKLKDHDISMNEQDNDGNTPLMLAIKSGNTKVIKYLIDFNTNINIKNLKGENTLFEAINNHNLKLVTFLINDGVDLNLYTYEKNENPLHRTALVYNKEKDNFDIFKIIFENEKNKSSLEDKMIDGNNLYHIVCLTGNIKLYEYLISKNVNIDEFNNMNYTGLDIAAENGQFEIMEKLIENHLKIRDTLTDERELVLHNRKLMRASKIANHRRHFNIEKILNKVIVEDIPDEIKEEIMEEEEINIFDDNVEEKSEFNMFDDNEEDVKTVNMFDDEEEFVPTVDHKEIINNKLEDALREVQFGTMDLESEEILDAFLKKHNIDKVKDKEVYFKLKNVYRHTIQKLIKKYQQLRPTTIKLSKEMFDTNFEEIESIDNTNLDPLIRYLKEEGITKERDYEIYIKVVQLYEKIIKELIEKFSELKPDIIKLAKKAFLDNFHDNEPY